MHKEIGIHWTTLSDQFENNATLYAHEYGQHHVFLQHINPLRQTQQHNPPNYETSFSIEYNLHQTNFLHNMIL